MQDPGEVFLCKIFHLIAFTVPNFRFSVVLNVTLHFEEMFNATFVNSFDIFYSCRSNLQMPVALLLALLIV